MKKLIQYSTVLASFLFIFNTACTKEPANPIIEKDSTPYVLNIGDLPPPNIASDNPLTQQGVKLGRMLFYETLLSADGSMSCASCHRQEHAFSDTSQFSIGVEGLPGGRQAMAVFNMAWNENEFFWDGRAHLLRDQSLMPIQDPLEMNESLENVVVKLSNEQKYRDQFIRAFGSDEITAEKMSLAMEQFMNSLVSSESKYDKYLRGDATLTANEEHGRYLFFQEFNPFFPDSSGADCAHCHGGANFENDQYMNNGLDTDGDQSDNGRENTTMNTSDKAKFKVTSLRNIGVTAPYMHDGRFNDLFEVVEHYNSGLKHSATLDPALDQVISNNGLGLSEQDKADLVAFLLTLTDKDFLTDTRYSDPI